MQDIHPRICPLNFKRGIMDDMMVICRGHIPHSMDRIIQKKMPEIVENGNTIEEQPSIEALRDHVDIETLKQAAKLESANLIAAERGGNESDIPKIEVETAPPVEDEPDNYQSNGNGTVESEPETIACNLEHNNGNTKLNEPEEHKENGSEHIEEHQNGHSDLPEQNGETVEEPLTIEEPIIISPIVHPQVPKPVSHQDQPDLICPMVKKEEAVIQEPIVEPKLSEPEEYREPVVCEMRAKFTEPKVHQEIPVANGVGAKKGVLNTKLDTASLKKAYEAVRSDQDDTEWAVFKFDGAILTTRATGTDFSSFQKEFGDAERAFAYIRIQTGDELSKRQKFLLVTWIGPEVSVLQRAKMSTDKAFVKTVVSNFAVELQPETSSEINLDHFVAELDKAGGAHYGTGL